MLAEKHAISSVFECIDTGLRRMLRELQIPKELQTQYLAVNDEGEEDPYLRLVGLSKLNIFIGPNNSGKSRLLRTLFASRQMVGASENTAGRDTDQIRSITKKLQSALFTLRVPSDYEEVRRDMLRQLSRCVPRLQNVGIVGNSDLRQDIGDLTDLGNSLSRLPAGARSEFESMFTDSGGDLGTLLNSLRDCLRADRQVDRQAIEQGLNRYYIPTLRGLRAIPGDDVYAAATARDYFGNAVATGDSKAGQLHARTLITGQSLCSDVRKYLLGTPSQRKLVADFEKFISSTFYRGQPLTLMPRDGSESLHINFGDDDVPVHELGDGVSQIIILLLPLFLHKNERAMIFIEEPELFLHAGFQRVFIEAALTTGDLVQLFVTSHSSQFLDVTLDRSRCSVYKCEKGDFQNLSQSNVPFKVSLSSSADLSILKELGVRNSSVLLSNCTIWVEGVTDRLYLSHFLRLYQTRPDHCGKAIFLEDLHFSFVEYGGGNVTHWSFLDEERGINVERLCGRAFLVADKDTKKEERHAALKSALGPRFYVLTCREVENLLSAEVVRAVVQSYEGSGVELKQFSRNSQFRSSSLGKFIEQHVLLNGKSKRRSKSGSPYADASGTIKDKTTFCSKAIERMKYYDDLTDDAKQLVQVVYEFIASENQ